MNTQDIQLEDLKRLACEACGISDMNNRRYKSVCARTLFYVELRKMDFSLHAIGRLTGKSHCNVYDLLKKYKDRTKYDKEFIIYEHKFRELLYEDKN